MATLCLKAPKLRGLKKPRPLHEATPPSSPLMEEFKVKEEPQDGDDLKRGNPCSPLKSQPTENANHNEKGNKNSKFFTATMEYTGDMLVLASTSIRTLMRVTTIVTQQLEAKLIKIETSEKGERSQESSFTEDRADQNSSLMNHSISSLPENRKYSSKELLMLAKSFLTRTKPKEWNKIRTEIPDIVREEPEYLNPDEVGPLNDAIFLNARPSYENRNRRPMATISQNDEDLEHPYGRANTLQKDFGGYFMPANTLETCSLRNLGLQSNQNRNASNNSISFSEINKTLEKDHSETKSLRNIGRQNSGNNNTMVKFSVTLDTEPVRDPDLRRPSGNNNSQVLDLQQSEGCQAPGLPPLRHPNGNHHSAPIADAEQVRYKVKVKEIRDVSPVRYEVNAEVSFDEITEPERFQRTASERFQKSGKERWPHDRYNPEYNVPLNFVAQPEKIQRPTTGFHGVNGSGMYQDLERYQKTELFQGSGTHNPSERWQHDRFTPDHRVKVVNTPNFFGGKFIYKSGSKSAAYVNPDKTISKFGLINDPLRVVDVDSFE